jgi:prepilin-type N-terminal cleavage/methylation domain-containing protein/prepilin-type processing-associated H-X9-DG protein
MIMALRPHKGSPRFGFSIPELLVVVGIIGVLLALLLPALVKTRKSAQSTVCLANLRQLAQGFQMYVNENNGRTFPEMMDTWSWVKALTPPGGRAVLLCPEASEPRPGRIPPGGIKPGTAVHAWEGGDLLGSYGFNRWIGAYGPRPEPAPAWMTYPIHVRAKEAERVPVLGDCTDAYTNALDTDVVPDNLQGHTQFSEMGAYCIDRHSMAVNVAFMDGHAERVPLAGLWKLKWSEGFRPREVTVPRR